VGDYSGGDWGHYYGALCTTIDGGKTWNNDSHRLDIPCNVTSLTFPTSTIGFAASGSIYKIELIIHHEIN
jgi:photosystem II stability/assembly factor-like uncharacterized protein